MSGPQILPTNYSIITCPPPTSQISFHEIKQGSTDRANQLVNQFPEGAEVTVYYNPDNPTQAVIVPGIGIGNYFAFAVGAVFLVLGIIFLFLGLYRK